jgi:hypothetical protein
MENTVNDVPAPEPVQPEDLVSMLCEMFTGDVTLLQMTGIRVKKFHVMSACAYLLLETALGTEGTPESHLAEVTKVLPEVMADILARRGTLQ